MAVLLQRIDWYPKTKSTDVDKVETLRDVQKITVRQVAETGASTCDITITNPIDQNIGSNATHLYVYKTGIIEFSEGDTFFIYLKYATDATAIDTSTTSDDLIMTAELAEFDVSSGENKTTITLKCVDKTYSMLNKLWVSSYTDRTAPTIIQDIIRQISGGDVATDLAPYDANGRRNINPLEQQGSYAIDARLMDGAFPCNPGFPPAYIQTRRPPTTTGGADSAFPNTDIAKVYKPAYEWIKDLSTPEHTNTAAELSGTTVAKRNYVFYIDQDNRFHWFYPRSSSRTTLSVAMAVGDVTLTVADGSSFDDRGLLQIGEELIEYTSRVGNVFGGIDRGFNSTTAVAHAVGDLVINAQRIIAGDTTTGHVVYNFKLNKKTFDIVNMVIFNAGGDLNGSGILDYFYDENTKSKDLKMTYKPWTHIARDLIKGELPTGQLGNNNLVQDDVTPGPFTYEGHFYNNAAAYPFNTAWGVSVTSDSNYNTQLRTEAIRIGDSQAQTLTLSRGSPRWKGTIELRGRRYRSNELINFTSYSAGIVNQDLRIKEVQHNIGKAGWFVSLTVEEDERERGTEP